MQQGIFRPIPPPMGKTEDGLVTADALPDLREGVRINNRKCMRLSAAACSGINLKYLHMIINYFPCEGSHQGIV